jgi:hypothetical protein
MSNASRTLRRKELVTRSLLHPSELAIVSRPVSLARILDNPQAALLRDRWTILATNAGAEIVSAEPFAGIDLELQALWAA